MTRAFLNLEKSTSDDWTATENRVNYDVFAQAPIKPKFGFQSFFPLPSSFSSWPLHYFYWIGGESWDAWAGEEEGRGEGFMFACCWFVYLIILGRKLNRQNYLLKEALREREEKEEKEKKKSN